MPQDAYIPEQSFRFGDDLYRSGQPMPMEVAKEHGLVETDEDGEEEAGETPLPDDFPYRSQLLDAGYETVESVAEAEPETLIDEVSQVGEGTIDSILSSLAETINS